MRHLPFTIHWVTRTRGHAPYRAPSFIGRAVIDQAVRFGAALALIG